jgi:uncharacterized protein
VALATAVLGSKQPTTPPITSAVRITKVEETIAAVRVVPISCIVPHLSYCFDAHIKSNFLQRRIAMTAEGAVSECRPSCGACCIAPSISSPIPGMPEGKAAGVRCVQLNTENRCKIFGDPRRPSVCSSLRASIEMCGADENVSATRVHAMQFLTGLEQATKR